MTSLTTPIGDESGRPVGMTGPLDPKVAAFIDRMAGLMTSSEFDDAHDDGMSGDDAIDALDDAIGEARGLTGATAEVADMVAANGRAVGVFVGGCIGEHDDFVGCVSRAKAQFFAVYFRLANGEARHLIDHDTFADAICDARDYGLMAGVPVSLCPFLDGRPT